MVKIDENSVDAIAKILHVSKDVLNSMIDGTSNYRFDSFKADQLKEVLAYLKTAGLYTSRKKMLKAELVEVIVGLLRGEDAGVARASDVSVNRTINNTTNNVRPVPAGPSSSLLKLSAVVDTPGKREAYMELMNIPGITQQEVLAELSSTDDPFPDPDTLLFQIISKRQAVDAIKEAQEAALVVQENADVDRAIAESEHERDVIQQRKRARVEELRDDPLCLISHAEEYKPSILLSRAPRTANNSNSSSSNNCSSPADSSIIGSACLLRLVRVIDNTFSANNPFSTQEDLDAILAARKALVALLLLEVDAMKYHKRAAIPYLGGLAIHLERRLSVLPALPGSIPDYIRLLEAQSVRLQRALYKLPRDGHMVPLLFRLAFADGELSGRVFNSTMDRDGFEMLTAGDVPVTAADISGAALASGVSSGSGSSSSSSSGSSGDGAVVDLYERLYEVESETEEVSEADDSDAFSDEE